MLTGEKFFNLIREFGEFGEGVEGRISIFARDGTKIRRRNDVIELLEHVAVFGDQFKPGDEGLTLGALFVDGPAEVGKIVGFGEFFVKRAKNVDRSARELAESFGQTTNGTRVDGTPSAHEAVEVVEFEEFDGKVECALQGFGALRNLCQRNDGHGEPLGEGFAAREELCPFRSCLCNRLRSRSGWSR